MMAITDSAKISGANSAEASGNIGMEKRKKPYTPIFRRMTARMTEPAVGASTWASGSQVCIGHIGSLTAKEARKANHSQVCIDAGKSWVSRVGMSVVPASQ